MPDTDRSAESTQPTSPDTTREPGVPLPLRSARRTLAWSARALCAGFFFGVMTLFLGLVAVDARGASAVFCVLSALGIASVVLIVLGLLGTVASGIVWLSILYFGYTRFSLRTLLTTVWVFAGILALLMSGNENLRATGIPLLIVFMIVLLVRIAANDPLAGPDLKWLVSPNNKPKPPKDKSHE